MSSKTRNSKAALILLAAGAAAIVSGQAQAVPTPQSCPASGKNNNPPFYGVSAAQIGHGKELHVAGNYRLKERNRKLTLTKSGGDSQIMKLRLRSNRNVGSSAGCPHFGGAFDAPVSVKQVQITDWNGKRIVVRVGRPSKNVSAHRASKP